MIIFFILIAVSIILVLFLITVSGKPDISRENDIAQLNHVSVTEELQKTIVSLRGELEQKKDDCNVLKAEMESLHKQQDILKDEIVKHKEMCRGLSRERDSLKQEMTLLIAKAQTDKKPMPVGEERIVNKTTVGIEQEGKQNKNIEITRRVDKDNKSMLIETTEQHRVNVEPSSDVDDTTESEGPSSAISHEETDKSKRSLGDSQDNPAPAPEQ